MSALAFPTTQKSCSNSHRKTGSALDVLTTLKTLLINTEY